jgi:hypothetical protein
VIEADAQEVFAIRLDHSESEWQLFAQIEWLGGLGGEQVAGVRGAIAWTGPQRSS